MKLRIKNALLLAAATAAVLAAPAAAQAEPTVAGGGKDHGPAAVGLTADQRLVGFQIDGPRRLRPIGAITGLVGDTRIVGIDYRIQDRLLYGVGDQGGVYTFADAVATKVSQLTVALTGTAHGVDFNPAADRLRVVGDTGQNLRHDLATDTTTADTDLTYPPAVTPALGVTAAAYTNNDLDPATGTTLYDLDTALDQTVIQSPANAGLLAPVGALGVDAATEAGFDIYSPVADGVVVGARGYATLSVGGTYHLYRVNLFTGAARDLGAFRGGEQVTDLAVKLA
ncbi:hypothetical protein Cme02nite_03650 [Catellatospora methionotrophica]|uniref:DUF4394 domain-containing protein n=1 Tax=Catellatospora methionotrophica TaxID=121620 RepID=A0A8J3PD52_9ACTN|nr:DUF4394 domain-containing protein [Catellatospora methionotrophica]GIG12033.1 hypothetical protein Cme02nite_03650 [Catellatospora methionotrophica]